MLTCDVESQVRSKRAYTLTNVTERARSVTELLQSGWGGFDEERGRALERVAVEAGHRDATAFGKVVGATRQAVTRWYEGYPIGAGRHRREVTSFLMRVNSVNLPVNRVGTAHATPAEHPQMDPVMAMDATAKLLRELAFNDVLKWSVEGRRWFARRLLEIAMHYSAAGLTQAATEVKDLALEMLEKKP